MALFNDFDNEYIADGNQIDYYVDSGVALLLFVFPGRVSLPKTSWLSERHNLHFLSMVGDTTDKEKIVEAALAGEHLFSNRVQSSAQGSTTHAAPRLMTPGHWTEFTYRLRGVVEEWQNQRSEQNIEKVAADNVEVARRALQQQHASPSPEDRSADILIDFVAACEETRDMELAMLYRVRNEQIVRPATDWGTSVFHVDPSEVDDWQRRLDEESEPNDNKRIDAIAIAQIEQLNKEFGHNRRACLVTADEVLHRAYYKHKLLRLSHFGERNKSGDVEPDIDRHARSRFLERFYLRHPAQFIASLNQADIDNTIKTQRLFNRTVSATDAWLAAVESTEIGALVLAMRALRDREEAREFIESSNLRDTPEDLPDVRELWAELKRESALVNRSLLARRIEYATSLKLEPGVQDEDDQKALQTQQLDVLREIQDLGLYVAAREALSRLKEKLAGSSVEQRLPYALLVGFEDFIGEDEKMESIVAKLVKNDKAIFKTLDDQINRKIESQRHSWQPLLFCSALAAWSSDRNRVIWFGERARDALEHRKDSDEYDEASYLVAVGRRLRLHENDYELADQALAETIARRQRVLNQPNSTESERSHSNLVLARAKSERATLRMYEQLRKVFAKDGESKGAWPESPLENAEMKEARKIFNELHTLRSHSPRPEHETPQDRREARAQDLVERQCKLNLALYDFLCHVILDTEDAFPDETNDIELEQEIAVALDLLMNEADTARAREDVETRIADVQRLDLVVLQIWVKYRNRSQKDSELQTLMTDAERLLSKINRNKTRAATNMDQLLADKMVTRLRDLLENDGALPSRTD